MGLFGGMLRISLAVSLPFLLGYAFYEPTINPLAEKWMQEVWPNKTERLDALESPEMKYRYGVCMASNVVLVLLINRYTTGVPRTVPRLLGMAIEVIVVHMCMQLPHTIFTQYSLIAQAIDFVESGILILLVTFILGFKRYEHPKHE